MANTSFERYRTIYEGFEPRPGPEATGIIDPDTYASIMGSPQTVTADLIEETVPILADPGHFGYINTGYYRRPIGASAGDMPTISQLTVPLGLATLPAIAEVVASTVVQRPSGLLLAFDYPTGYDGYTREPGERNARALPSDDEKRFVKIMADMGLSTKQLTNPADVHYHFVDQLTHEAGSTNGGPVVEAINSEAMVVKQDDESGLTVSIDPAMTDHDIDSIWDFYNPAHQGISSVDPVMPGLSEKELASVLKSPDYIKSVCRVGEAILSILILVDARTCPWADQRYFSGHKTMSDKYHAGQVLFGAGVVSNFDAMRGLKLSGATSVEAIGAVGKRFVQLGIEPAIVVTCNRFSHFKVKPASIVGLEQNGVQSTFPLASVQRFGAVLLKSM